MDNRNWSSRQVGGLWRSLRDGDFEEEDVWAVLNDREDHHSSPENGRNVEPFVSVFPRNQTSAARTIPGSARSASSSISSSSSSITPHEEKRGTAKRQSAPVNIPVWPKHYSRNTEKGVDVGDDSGEDGGGGGGDDDDDDEWDNKMAPHEFVARRLARSQISSFSVFEGVGRTLKGRDLSKVRNAVLTKTGFLER